MNVTSSTAERKSRCYVLEKKGKLYLKHNVFTKDIPICIAFRCMGIESDQEIMALVVFFGASDAQIGNEPKYRTYFNQSIEEAHELGIFTQQQALKWVGSLVSMRKGRWSRKRSAEEEGREVFNTTILCHVPVVRYDFWPKCVYLAYMTRECLQCIFDHSLLSDKDYYGNKRIETAGDLMSLLFEDLFKMYNAKVKEFVNKSLQKVRAARAAES